MIGGPELGSRLPNPKPQEKENRGLIKRSPGFEPWQLEETLETERRARKAAVEAAQKDSDLNLKGEAEVRKKALGAVTAAIEQVCFLF